MNILRIKKLIFLHLQHLPMKSRAWRPLVCKWGGVQIISPKRTFIGEGVIFDTNYPQDIFIEEGVRLTSGVKIVTHFMNPNTGSYDRGKVHICKGAYLGMNTLVVKPVTIGERAIIGAGSVVTKDIPANEVWAGNPAKFIRKRLTEAQLRNRIEPDKGLLIAESPKVIHVALNAGYEPLALLCEQKHITGDAAGIIERCGDIPVYTGERKLLATLTGYTLTRGVLCAMRRRALPSAEIGRASCRERV